MNQSRLLILFLVVTIFIASFLAWRNISTPMDISDLKTTLTITTETFAGLLGIITAGLMFTHGKFSELATELEEKSPSYLSDTLSMENIQMIGNSLLALRKSFSVLITQTTVQEEKSLYKSIIEKAASMYVCLAILSDLKLTQQGLRGTDLMISGLDPPLYKKYKKERNQVKKEWQILAIVKQIVETWQGSGTLILEKHKKEISLQQELRSSASLLMLKERLAKDSNVQAETRKIHDELSESIGKISRQLLHDRIPQLLSQMENAKTVRGKYFYLVLAFIGAPLFINLFVLPQLSIGTTSLFQPVISITSSLCVMGIASLLLYINRMLAV